LNAISVWARDWRKEKGEKRKEWRSRKEEQDEEDVGWREGAGERRRRGMTDLYRACSARMGSDVMCSRNLPDFVKRPGDASRAVVSPPAANGGG
jgi:hypothetical protein